jgi:hypothetical protein
VQYLLMIYDNEKNRESRSEAEMAEYLGAFRTFTEGIQKSGEMVAGDALQPVAMATSVRVREGKVLLTDGPFAETREQLGGYYLVEAENLDRAIAIAAEIPTAKSGTIEVRPIFVWNA